MPDRAGSWYSKAVSCLFSLPLPLLPRPKLGGPDCMTELRAATQHNKEPWVPVPVLSADPSQRAHFPSRGLNKRGKELSVPSSSEGLRASGMHEEAWESHPLHDSNFQPHNWLLRLRNTRGGGRGLDSDISVRTLYFNEKFQTCFTK